MKAKDIQPRNSANVTPEVIEAWKKEHPRGVWRMAIDTDDIESVTVETDAKGKKTKITKYVQKIGYVRKPTRPEMSAAMTIKNDVLKQAEEMLRDAWLGGDEELLNDEEYLNAATAQFSELMEVRRGEIKKL